MRLIVDIVKSDDTAVFSWDVVIIKKVVQRTLEIAAFPSLYKKNISVAIALTGADEIRRLNAVYRHKDAITDVLSFSEYEDAKAMQEEISDNVFLGDLVICCEYVEQAAKEDGVSAARAMKYIISHGVLHLLGFDHSDRMFAIQDQVTDEILMA